MDPLTALVVGAAALVTAIVGVVRLRRETPDLNEARLQRNVSGLEDMLETYERDRARFLQELERERGKVETLERELEEERQRAKGVIDQKQALLDASLRKIAILDHTVSQKDEQIQELRSQLRKRLGGDAA